VILPFLVSFECEVDLIPVEFVGRSLVVLIEVSISHLEHFVDHALRLFGDQAGSYEKICSHHCDLEQQWVVLLLGFI